MEKTEFSKLQRNLTALIEFSRVVNSSLDIEFTLNNLLFSCMGKFLSTKGLIALSSNNVLTIHTIKGFADDIKNEFPTVETGEAILDNPGLIKFLKKRGLVLVEKIESSRRFLGIICFGEKINKKEYSTDEKEFLKTVLNIASSAIENSIYIDELKKVNRDLDTRVNRLSSLFELGKEFALITDESRLSKVLVYTLLGHFLVSTYSVLTFDNGKMKILESTLPKTRLAETSKNYHLQEITSSLFAQQINLIYPELSQFNIEVIVPMQLQGETKGLIILGRRGNKLDYTESDIEFISSLGSLAIVSLENKRLFKEALEKQRLEEELEIAKDIQRNLLPGTIPELKNFDIAASTISSKQVGGDYYDIISLEDNMYCVSIGDVSGKGVPAALLMANLQAFLKSICKQGMKLEIATGVINDLISENTSDGRFITFFWGIINDEKRTFSFVNAGHNPPVLIRNGEITYLSKGGMLLGVMKTLFPYEREDLTLQKDDLIVMFTDGITEAKNAEDEEFSDERLEILLKEVVTESSENIMKRIKKELEKFTKGYPQSDDITMMVIKVK